MTGLSAGAGWTGFCQARQQRGGGVAVAGWQGWQGCAVDPPAPPPKDHPKLSAEAWVLC